MEHACLQFATPKNGSANSIAKLASSHAYAYKGDTIERLADDLAKHEDVLAVCIVDENRKIAGIVVRKELYAMLGRPFGRDVLKKRRIEEITRGAVRFNSNHNIFSIAEEIDHLLRDKEISYFILAEANDEFAGIFSTRDMLIYLSDITKNDISLARHLQTRFVKEHMAIKEKGFEVVAASITAKGVGGDFYSIQRYDDNRYIVALCDVSGKGVAASVVTSALWGMMNIFDFRQGITRFIMQVNNYLFRNFEAEKFITGVFLDIDQSTGEIQVCDMGHSYLFILRDGKFLKIRTNQNNVPIGIMSDIFPQSDSLFLKRNDVLFLPTDGLLEQENMEGKLYTVGRIAAVMKRDISSLEKAHIRILQDFHSFRGQHHLHDDVTFLLMRYEGIREEEQMEVEFDLTPA